VKLDCPFLLLETETGNSTAEEETHMEHINWQGFAGGDWHNEINVRDFISATTGNTPATNPSWPDPRCALRR